MQRCLPLIFFSLFLYSQLSAQLGFTVAQTQGFAKEWQILVENYVTGRNSDFLKFGNTATIDYTFQLSSPEWQFEPALYGMRANMIHHGNDFDVYAVGIVANVNYAPFLEEGENIGSKKAIFYIQASPGLSYVRQRYQETIFEDGHLVGRKSLTDKHISPSFGINALLKIKLTQLLSISPMVGLRYFPNLKWEGFSEIISDGAFQNEFDTVDWRHVSFGIRIGLSLKNSNQSF